MPSVQFNDLAKLFAEHFRRVQNCVDPRYVRPDWVARNLELERHLLPVPPVDFLRHPAIRYQMFVDERVVAHELPFIRRRLPDDHLLAEDPIGDPPTTTLPDSGVRTSSNTVHQLFHLLRYEETTGRQLGDIGTVVEWGGGFGSLMRLLVRRHGGQPTCVIFDTPIFSAVQWLYLSAVLGEGGVVLHSSAPVEPVAGRINLVPIGLAMDTTVAADLFISNWALNESTSAAQHDVIARDWFGAHSLLLAMHAGDPLTERALGRGARAVPLGDFMPGQQYLVA
ncbi:hypothetical protein GCM10010533_29940 [Mycolicibacterium pallens]